jgi:hypothetical protein
MTKKLYILLFKQTNDNNVWLLNISLNLIILSWYFKNQYFMSYIILYKYWKKRGKIDVENSFYKDSIQNLHQWKILYD